MQHFSEECCILFCSFFQSLLLNLRRSTEFLCVPLPRQTWQFFICSIVPLTNIILGYYTHSTLSSTEPAAYVPWTILSTYGIMGLEV